MGQQSIIRAVQALREHYSRESEIAGQILVASPDEMIRGLKYLAAFGDLRLEEEVPPSPDELTASIKEFQRKTGVLEPNGALEAKTLRFIERTPRYFDAVKLSDESREARRGGGLREIVYSSRQLPTVHDGDAFDILARAWASWGDVVGFSTRYTENGEEAHAVVTTSALDYYLIAQTDLGPVGGRPLKLRLAEEETWIVQPSSAAGGIVLEAVLCHEIGHLLGLRNDPHTSSNVMSPFYNPHATMPTRQEGELARSELRPPERTNARRDGESEGRFSQTARTHDSAVQPDGLFPGEDRDIEREIIRNIPNYEVWMETPHERLGGKTPNELADSDQGREVLRDLARAVRDGIFS